ncbi:hypothetical protein ALC57_00151 [Trachymyrmex cornetzi]|uniref:Uncharacterized protein n=2 Tax=Trachymyrmex cornetzi TaxID=471704 RepID=A0A151K354_9HYME|nr:hypothetical protein ALC57_00679 [Trachymyrmex cornetzi]KYN50512.1 hypothetical protein ALC57_00151 [Trachymyrmex cornetzi]
MLLFQRICITKQNEEELKEHFKWELSPYPLSLFLDGALRKTVKSSIFDLFTPEEIQLPTENCSFVIDGGMLLQGSMASE